MVNARLHVICGNCGSVGLDYKHSDLDFADGPDEAPHDGTHFYCHNCVTIHNLDSWQEFQSYQARKRL